MEKILFLLMLLLPEFAIASDRVSKEDVKLTSSEVANVNEYNIFARVTVSASDITLPFTITVPAPDEKIIGINGPVHPNIQNWKVENGHLIITYTHGPEIIEILDGGTFYIEVATSLLKYYAIELTVD